MTSANRAGRRPRRRDPRLRRGAPPRRPPPQALRFLRPAARGGRRCRRRRHRHGDVGDAAARGNRRRRPGFESMAVVAGGGAGATIGNDVVRIRKRASGQAAAAAHCDDAPRARRELRRVEDLVGRDADDEPEQPVEQQAVEPRVPSAVHPNPSPLRGTGARRGLARLKQRHAATERLALRPIASNSNFGGDELDERRNGERSSAAMVSTLSSCWGELGYW